MAEDLEFVYNTRLRTGSLTDNFQQQLSSALQRDFALHTEADEELDLFEDQSGENTDFVPEDDASDIEYELEIEANEIFDSDEESEEESENAPTQAADGFLLGKDGTKWSTAEPATVRFRQHNVMRFRGGPKTNLTTPLEVFKLFFSPNITFIIVTQTNLYGEKVTRKWNAEHANCTPRVWVDMTSVELDAFIGILLAFGVSHNTMQLSRLMWQTDALPIFRAAMSYRRFVTLMRCIRFDDSRTRAFRQQTDKAAPIRDIWNFLNNNLASNFEPYESVTIDEQLFPYRGRTKFTQYIPSKPAKYGIKVWWACDAKTKYPLQGKLYTGKEGEQRETNQGENVLMSLANRYTNSGRTIIADNFFTTLDAAKRLSSIGLAYVGTIRSNKRCLPKEVKKDSKRPVLSSVFGFYDNLISLCSYVPKKNKAVNLLSTVHYTKKVEGVAKKPEAILFYNSTKAGVDTMDQMVTHYSTKRSTRRWPLAFFCNMIDVMGLAAYIICNENIEGTRKEKRRLFLNTLSKQLVLANTENRMNNNHILGQHSTRLAIESFFGRPLNIPSNMLPNQQSGPSTLNSRKDCRICVTQDEKLRRKTRFYCTKCTNPVCQQHSKVDYTCFSCIPQNE